jgi:hypothetical protein
VKNISGILVCFKEYTLPILFIMSQAPFEGSIIGFKTPPASAKGKVQAGRVPVKKQ